MLGDNAAELWIEDIVEVVNAVKRHSKESSNTANVLAGINSAMVDGNDSAIVDILRLAIF